VFTNGIWKDGELTTGSNKFFAAPHSQLSVISYMPGIDAIHLFFQDRSHKIREIMYTSSWKAGTNALPMAAAGTSLSACALESQPGYMWLYCQDTDMKPIEMQYQGGNWFKGKCPNPIRRLACLLLSLHRTFRTHRRLQSWRFHQCDHAQQYRDPCDLRDRRQPYERYLKYQREVDWNHHDG
jgi:hypothetical protein